MKAEIVDIESLRSRRVEAARAEAASFGRLPCPCCDRMTAGFEVVNGDARYACDGIGTHDPVGWSYNGITVSDHMGRIRKYFAY